MFPLLNVRGKNPVVFRDHSASHRHNGSDCSHLKTLCNWVMVPTSIWVAAVTRLVYGKAEYLARHIYSTGIARQELLYFYSLFKIQTQEFLRGRKHLSLGLSSGNLLQKISWIPTTALLHWFSITGFLKSFWFNNKLLMGSDHICLAHLWSPELVKLNKYLLNEWMSLRTGFM